MASSTSLLSNKTSQKAQITPIVQIHNKKTGLPKEKTLDWKNQPMDTLLYLWINYELSIGIGSSMKPLFPYFGITVQKRLNDPANEVQVGDIVCFHPPKEKLKMLKRIHKIENDGIYALGDNPCNSVDSRYFGIIPFKNVTHKTVFSMVPLRFDLSKRDYC
ncbi:hypothetical protein L596_030914 [Steinernema carpocapsae]|uniref:Peptidase S26 domain-containing protein n=1 Tax=Steinernema carpocapsae TaxID=34508 RepID=A0A4V6XVV7_STECR|nr:hypothetical protein L596_030914 [Steinernema carpocapsae]